MGKLTIYNEEEQRYQLVEEPDASYSYSYADYLQWKFKERLELIRGSIFQLSAPNTNHQIVSGELYFQLKLFLKAKPCNVFTAPFDVRLPRPGKTADNLIKTVVQPDICVVCDESKIDAKGVCGAPDLVIEILSPGNSKHEVRTKFELYEESGVREYWLINPEEENIFVYLLDENKKFSFGKTYAGGDIISSTAVAGFTIDVEQLFKNKRKPKEY
jgi:Uma2 family endonuclease